MKKIPGAFLPPFDNLEGTPPASVHIPEQASVPPMPPVKAPAKGADEYITISVAEYHFLTKSATLLETIMNCQSYHRDGLVEAARKILAIEAGADQ